MKNSCKDMHRPASNSSPEAPVKSPGEQTSWFWPWLDWAIKKWMSVVSGIVLFIRSFGLAEVTWWLLTGDWTGLEGPRSFSYIPGILVGSSGRLGSARLFSLPMWSLFMISCWCMLDFLHDSSWLQETKSLTGFRMRNTCIPVADSFWCLAKIIQLCKV